MRTLQLIENAIARNSAAMLQQARRIATKERGWPSKLFDEKVAEIKGMADLARPRARKAATPAPKAPAREGALVLVPNKHGHFGSQITLLVNVLPVEVEGTVAAPTTGHEGRTYVFTGTLAQGPRGGWYYDGTVATPKGIRVGTARWYLSLLKPFTFGNRAHELRVLRPKRAYAERLGICEFAGGEFSER